ncbi:hypothetical protein AVEN_91534-1 [Araneus ventricosus]|uniref:Uncharacterized protein n=1 Tax=Araneus ventricosus TaxID=182803 RepID=A0A4Y2BIW2_ARAVE|nr:hypothetical protein AVEN_91534-1 [Araneus ventricosus]
MRRWHWMLEETGCVCKKATSRRPRVSAKNNERICARMNEAYGNRRTKAVTNATKNGMACSQKEAENETARNSTCAAIETGRLWQTYELRYIYAGKHGG